MIRRYDTDVEPDVYEFMADEGGYFLISRTSKPGQIAVAHMQNNDEPGHFIVLGTDGEKVRHAMGLLAPWLSRYHALYLGAEIEKALLAARFDLAYVQDEPLPIHQVVDFRQE